MVRELLTATPGNRQPRELGGQVAEVNDGTSPLSFYQAKQFKPESLAEATARVLLGVRLGCAQCHNHPTADWKRERFWEYAAFFAEAAQLNGQQQAAPAKASPRELKIPDTDQGGQGPLPRRQDTSVEGQREPARCPRAVDHPQGQSLLRACNGQSALVVLLRRRHRGAGR